MAPPFFFAACLSSLGHDVEKRSYSFLDLISDFAKLVRVHFFGVRYLPILMALCADERTLVAAAHRRDEVPFHIRQIIERF